MTTVFAPIAASDQASYSTRPEAEHALAEIIGAGVPGDIAVQFDLQPVFDTLIDWHCCMIEGDGQQVEWLPGNGFVIRQFQDDVDEGSAPRFWDLVAQHAREDFTAQVTATGRPSVEGPVDIITLASGGAPVITVEVAADEDYDQAVIAVLGETPYVWLDPR